MPDQRPPRGLRPATRRWFADVASRWTLEEHHLRLLELACRAYDEASEGWDADPRARLLLAHGVGSRP